MLDFHRLHLSQREAYNAVISRLPERSCEYTFANLYLWGRQQVVFEGEQILFFSHFGGKSLYPYPVGTGDRLAAVNAVIADSQERGIPCRFSSMTEEECQELESWFPGTFLFRPDRDSFDYVYDIHALAELKGKKLQKKRNHVNRFWAEHPGCTVEPLTAENMDIARSLVDHWFQTRQELEPDLDRLLERVAINRAFDRFDRLGMEGILLMEEGRCLAMTMGSQLSPTTFDTHFEKAREDVDGAYAAVNQEFARYLSEKYPGLLYINREDDLGREGLRKAKLSYHPHHMMEKFTAYRKEDIYDHPEA